MRENPPLEVILCSPRGFCAGVERAVDIVERAIKTTDRPVYVRHEIVHNKRVVDTLSDKGAVFVNEVEEIPEGEITVFSAHGVATQVEKDAKRRNLSVIDATCPLVSKVHIEGQKYAEQGYEVLLIGHSNHPEVIGTMGRIDGAVHLVSTPTDVAALKVKTPPKIAYISQTTLCTDDTKEVVAAIKSRFPEARGQNLEDICYATRNRQQSARRMAKMVDAYFVIGSHNSSNSQALKKIGDDRGLAAYLLSEPEDFDPSWIKGASRIGVTSGASTPEELVQEFIAVLRRHRRVKVRPLETIRETLTFNLPRALERLEKTGAAAQNSR